MKTLTKTRIQACLVAAACLLSVALEVIVLDRIAHHRSIGGKSDIYMTDKIAREFTALKYGVGK